MWLVFLDEETWKLKECSVTMTLNLKKLKLAKGANRNCSNYDEQKKKGRREMLNTSNARQNKILNACWKIEN